MFGHTRIIPLTRKNMIPVRENSEVVTFTDDMYIYIYTHNYWDLGYIVIDIYINIYIEQSDD